jgi:hypothetical protein
MKIIIKTPLWTKPLYAIGIFLLAIGIASHFFGWPNIPDKYMAICLIGGVVLIIPYQFFALYEILKYRPKDE